MHLELGVADKIHTSLSSSTSVCPSGGSRQKALLEWLNGHEKEVLVIYTDYKARVRRASGCKAFTAPLPPRKKHFNVNLFVVYEYTEVAARWKL